ncbi:MAG: amidohydrolase family protein, partial [Haloglomus sp.]
VAQGVPEKFPGLDISFMESGVTYLPGLMTRLDEEYLKRPEEAPLLEKRPSEYISDFYYGTQPLEISADPEYLGKCVEMVGTDSLMFASDYPHWDYDRPTTVLDLPFLDEDEKKQILSENAREVFGL